jgi:hypothetical protein
LFLYWCDWHAYPSFGDWIGHPFGIVITIGAVSAIIAWFIGNFGIGRTVEQLIEVGDRVAAATGTAPPGAGGDDRPSRSPDEGRRTGGSPLPGIAVRAMATAPYW